MDELAHSNAPGSERQKRWQDVEVLLQAGIDVLTTTNVQDLASLSDQIWQLTGLRVRETVPDWLFQQADEVVIVDVTPRALLHRLERGVIYPADRVKTESERLFQEPVLVALRELAIRQTAQALEARQTGKAHAAGLTNAKKSWSTSRRIRQPPCCYAGQDGLPIICKPFASPCTSIPKRNRPQYMLKTAQP